MRESRMSGSWRPAWLLAVFMLFVSCGGGGDGTSLFGGGSNARFGFALNAGDDTLSVYLVDAGSGQWRPHGYVRTGSGPAAVATDPAGKFVYVANGTAATLSAYRLVTASGQLVEVAGSPYPAAGANPSALAVEASGKFLYVANRGSNDIVAYSINATSGALAQIDADPLTGGVNTISTGGTAPVSLVIDPTGKFLYAANSGSGNLSAFAIDATNGALTAIALYTTGITPVDAAIDATGKYLYLANSGSDNISGFSINTTTGALAGLTGSPFTAGAAGSGTQSISLHPSGKFAYVANYTANQLVVFQMDTTTGIFGASTTVTAEPGPRAVRVDPSGRFLFHVSETNRYTVTYGINGTSGALSVAKQLVRTRAQPLALAYTKGAALSARTRNAYVANYFDGTIGYYNADATSGALLYQSAVMINPTVQPKAVVTDLYGRFAYTANYLDGSVSGFTINSIGALTNLGAASAGIYPTAAVVEPGGRFLYVVNREVGGGVNGSVSAYSIAQGSGVLSPLGATAVGVEPCAIAVDPAGQYLYVVNCDPTNLSGGSVAAFAINVNTGGLTPVTGSPFAAGLQPTSAAVDPSGRFLYVTNTTANPIGSVSIYAITAGTGAITASGSATTGDTPVSIALDPKGRFAYVANSSSDSVGSYTLNSSTGALTPVSAPSTLPQPVWVSADPSGRFVYTVDAGGELISLFSVNSATGTLTKQGGTFTGAGPSCLALTTSIQ